jgi:hypothetical protein
MDWTKERIAVVSLVALKVALTDSLWVELTEVSRDGTKAAVTEFYSVYKKAGELVY